MDVEASGDELRVMVLTPERPLLEVRAKHVNVPGREGYLGILPGHAGLVAEMGIGELLVEEVGVQGANARAIRYFVSGGYLEVTANRVQVLASVAEERGGIDRKRAEKALERALARLGEKSSTLDTARAELAAARARARLAILGS